MGVQPIQSFTVLPQLQPANQVKTHVISNVYFRLSQRPDDDGKC